MFPLVAQCLAALSYLIWMRPDPLLESRRRSLAAAATAAVTGAGAGDLRLVRVAIITLALSHATMIALMSMTPVHLVHDGASLSVVGFTLSLHIAGMFALSPVFGVLADRVGRLPTIALGQLLLLAAAVVTALGPHSTTTVMVGLTLLGLGWSASTVAGSALLNDAAPADRRLALQGRSDLTMNLAGAVGGGVAGRSWPGSPTPVWPGPCPCRSPSSGDGLGGGGRAPLVEHRRSAPLAREIVDAPGLEHRRSAGRRSEER